MERTVLRGGIEIGLGQSSRQLGLIRMQRNLGVTPFQHLSHFLIYVVK
jgi:hypothetical protein